MRSWLARYEGEVLVGLPFSMWVGARPADYLVAQTGLRMTAPSVHKMLRAGDMGLSYSQHRILSSDPDYALQEKTIEEACSRIGPLEVFYYADEFFHQLAADAACHVEPQRPAGDDSDARAADPPL